MGYSGAILKNSEGKILFQLRDKNGRTPTKWGIFGGRMKKNEQPVNALIREIKEEMGIHLPKSEIIRHHKIPLINYHVFEVYLKKKPKILNQPG